MASSDVAEAEATSTTEAEAPVQGAAVVTEPKGDVKPDAAKTETKPETKVETKVEPAKPDENPVAEQPKTPTDFVFKDAKGEPIKSPVIDALASVAKEHGWTQEVAEKQLGVLAQGMRDSHKAELAKWQAEVIADKEIGGDKLAENLAISKKALDALGSPELTKFLDESGLGSHPAMVRAWIRVGKAISPDKFTAGVPIAGRPGDLPDPNDTSVAAFARKYADPAQP